MKEEFLDPFNLNADRITDSKIRYAMVGGFLSEDGYYESKFFGASYWSMLRDEIFQLMRDIGKRRKLKTEIRTPYRSERAYYCCRYIIEVAQDFNLALVIGIHKGDHWRPSETAHIVLPWC